jgi:riboflavin-specific deaminase-like protein
MNTVGKRPFVLVNMAMTADGKIATANRRISSFGSRRDQEHLLELRATVDAVMAGARTVDLNPVNLGPGPERFRKLRRRRGLAEYNLRIIVSRLGSVNAGAAIFRQRFSPILVLASGRAPERRLRRLRPLADVVRVGSGNEIDFGEELAWLRANWGVRRLLCEGGGELNDALFRAGLVDELHLTICPTIFGGREAPTIADGLGVDRLHQATPLVLVSLRRYGAEVFAVYRAVRVGSPRLRGPRSQPNAPTTTEGPRAGSGRR